MKTPKKKTTKPRQTPKATKPAGADARAIAGALRAIVAGGERGTLSRTAAELGMDVSAFRKRLQKDGAGLDEASILAVLLIWNRKAENFESWPVTSTADVGRYVIETRHREGVTVTTWKTAAKNN